LRQRLGCVWAVSTLMFREKCHTNAKTEVYGNRTHLELLSNPTLVLKTSKSFIQTTLEKKRKESLLECYADQDYAKAESPVGKGLPCTQLEPFLRV
jgi:hypothetical protein